MGAYKPKEMVIRQYNVVAKICSKIGVAFYRVCFEDWLV